MNWFGSDCVGLVWVGWFVVVVGNAPPLRHLPFIRQMQTGTVKPVPVWALVSVAALDHVSTFGLRRTDAA